jgi:hypothetical protein
MQTSDPLGDAILKLISELPMVAVLLIVFRWQTESHARSIAFYREEASKTQSWIRDNLTRLLDRIGIKQPE